jgi:hypothetical protein
MSISPPAPGVVGPFAGLDVPELLRMRGQTRRDRPFPIWAPFEAPARIWAYAEFHERVGALAARDPFRRRDAALGAGKSGEGGIAEDGGVRRLRVSARTNGDRSVSSSFRGDAKHRTRNLEIPDLVLRTIPE